MTELISSGRIAAIFSSDLLQLSEPLPDRLEAMGHGPVDDRVAEQDEQAALQRRIDLGFNRDFLAGHPLQLRLEAALLGRGQPAPACHFGLGRLQERRGIALGPRLLVHVLFHGSSWIRYLSWMFSWIGSLMVVCTRCSAASRVRRVASWRSSRTALSRSIWISFFTLAKAACTWAAASDSSLAFVFSASASAASSRRCDSWVRCASLSFISARRFEVSCVSWSIFLNVSSISCVRAPRIFPSTGTASLARTPIRMRKPRSWTKKI